MCQAIQAGVTRGLGVCVQCVRSRCYTAFHVTCAQYRGLLSEDCDDRSGLACHKHYFSEVSPACVPDRQYDLMPCVQEQEGVEIATGEEVYVEQEGGVVSGRVTEVTSQTQYEVAFEDGSVCSNLSPSDIVVSLPPPATTCLNPTPPSPPPPPGPALLPSPTGGQATGEVE